MVLLYLLMIKLVFTPDFQVITGTAQGTTYTIKYVGELGSITKIEIDSIFSVLDQSLSLYLPGSLINQFNSRGVVKMDVHMKAVVLEAMKIAKESDGAFDITVGALSDLWGFGPVPHQQVPRKREIKKRLRVTGSRYISVRDDMLVALEKGVKIDCNGIAQGYSVDVVAAFLQARGIDRMMVELGGEIRVSGKHPDKDYWTIGIESPGAIAGDWYPVEKMIRLNDAAVTTSGDYRKFFTAGGKTFGHVIDPRQGRPVNNWIISVTVIAGDAITADAWDNAFFVMGIENSLEAIRNKPGIEAYMIYKNKEGAIRDTATTGFQKRRVDSSAR
jgi:thiamine biosynthesis lipoprotein